MAQEIPKANILISHVEVTPEEKDSFVDWQSQLQNEIANFPGFLSLEILAPNDERPTWAIVQRFLDAPSANAWKASAERKKLFSHLHQQEVKEVFSDERSITGVTEVIITETSSEKRKSYGQWLAKIHQAEAKLPGFRGVYVQSPKGKRGKYWVTFLQFDTAEHLDNWLSSPERQEILKELDPAVTTFESHRVISPFAGWFGSIVRTGQVPARWKQTLLILLVLFPIVMLEFRYVNPLTKGLNISSATFIANAISVSLISWPTLPIAIYFFRWWLVPQSKGNSTRTNILGLLILVAIYLIEIAIFWSFI